MVDYTFRPLGIFDVPAIQAILEEHATVSFSDTAVLDNVKQLLAKQIVINSTYFVLGAVDENDNLLAFLYTENWKDLTNYTLGIGSVTKTVTLPKSGYSRWPQVMIDLINHMVGFYYGQRMINAWVMQPDDESWVPFYADFGCVLNQYTATVERHVAIQEPLEGDYTKVAWQGLLTPQVIVKLAHPNDGPVENLPEPIVHGGVESYNPYTQELVLRPADTNTADNPIAKAVTLSSTTIDPMLPDPLAVKRLIPANVVDARTADLPPDLPPVLFGQKPLLPEDYEAMKKDK